MNITKNSIVSRINQLLISFRVKWEDIVVDLDMAVDRINDYMSTIYPPFSEILNDFSDPDKTYSYRAGGYDVPFFPVKYIHSIVVPFVITQILTREEEFGMIYSRYASLVEENLFIMVRDELDSVPAHLISAPKGVYFQNPDPIFKKNPEAYFNRAIVKDIPRIKVRYSWGDFKELLPLGVDAFVEKPLPVDNNSYEINALLKPAVMSMNDYRTLLVSSSRAVVGIFLGWSLSNDNDADGIINGYITLDQDKTFYAVFDLDVHGIIYEGNGGTLHNWGPTYVEKTLTDPIVPQGGTAYRKGFRFDGFSPEEINLEEPGEEEVHDVLPEENLVFTANWNRLIYSIEIIGLLESESDEEYRNRGGRTNYIYGEQFALVEPKILESDPDYFIGFFDNPEFSGNRVTHITEEDFGNKIFYAHFLKENVVLNWVNNYQSIDIKRNVLLNSIINVPTIDSLDVRPNTFIFINDIHLNVKGNIEHSFSFKEFISEQETIPLRANKSMLIEPSFIPSMVGAVVDVYGEFINSETIITLHIFFKGQMVKVSRILEVIKLDTNYQQTYDDGGTTKIISGIVGYEIDEEITLTAVNDLTLEYSASILEIKYSFGAGLEETRFLPSPATGEQLELLGASIQEIDWQEGEDFLSGFDVLGAPLGKETSYTEEEFTAGITLTPRYDGIDVEQSFMKTIWIYNYPNSITKETGPSDRTGRIGSDLDLATIVSETQGFYYYEISSFERNGQPIPTEPITFSEVNENIFAVLEEKPNVTLKFKISGDTIYSGQTFFPFEFYEGFKTIHSTIVVQGLIKNFIPSGQLFLDQWKIEGEEFSSTISIMQPINTDEELTLVPHFREKKGFKVKVNFKNEFGNPLLIKFDLNKDYEKTFPYTQENKVVTLFENFGDMSSKVFTYSGYSGLGNLFFLPFARGYEIHSFKQGSVITNETLVFVHLPPAGITIQELTIEVRLKFTATAKYKTMLNEIVDPPNPPGIERFLIPEDFSHVITQMGQTMWETLKDIMDGNDYLHFFVRPHTSTLTFGQIKSDSFFLPEFISPENNKYQVQGFDDPHYGPSYNDVISNETTMSHLYRLIRISYKYSF